MAIASGVAVRLMRLSLPSSGRLRGRLLIDSAVCGAVLADLALARRLGENDTGIYVDPTPTGFGPADELLADIHRAPPRGLEWWFNTAKPGEEDLADHLVRIGEWDRHPPTTWQRYVRYQRADTGGQRSAGELRDGLETALNRFRESPEAAAVACIVRGLGLGVAHSRPRPEMIEGCGDADWVVAALLDYLDDARDTFAAKSARSWTNPVAAMAYTIKATLEDRHYR